MRWEPEGEGRRESRERIARALLRILRVLGLVVVFFIIGFIWPQEWIFRQIAKRPKIILMGTNPIGAAQVIKTWLGLWIKVFSGIRRLAGRYVRRYYGRIFARLERFFT